MGVHTTHHVGVTGISRTPSLCILRPPLLDEVIGVASSRFRPHCGVSRVSSQATGKTTDRLVDGLVEEPRARTERTRSGVRGLESGRLDRSKLVREVEELDEVALGRPLPFDDCTLETATEERVGVVHAENRRSVATCSEQDVRRLREGLHALHRESLDVVECLCQLTRLHRGIENRIAIAVECRKDIEVSLIDREDVEVSVLDELILRRSDLLCRFDGRNEVVVVESEFVEDLVLHPETHRLGILHRLDDSLYQGDALTEVLGGLGPVGRLALREERGREERGVHRLERRDGPGVVTRVRSVPERERPVAFATDLHRANRRELRHQLQHLEATVVRKLTDGGNGDRMGEHPVPDEGGDCRVEKGGDLFPIPGAE